MKITIVGTGYVGLVTGACFSEVGHQVLCVDKDERKVNMLRANKMPIYEPGLDEVVARNVAAGRLRFSTSLAEGTEYAEVIFIAVGTPPGVEGQADLSYVEQVVREVAEHMSSYRLLVEKSTVPVNTAEQIKRTVLRYSRKDVAFDVASNPEFLREGTAIEDALQPDRVVVGVESERASQLLRAIYEPIIARGGGVFVEMGIASAELTKHASNSFLAMKISYINAVSRICELAGADVEQVANGMGLDRRIGRQFLKAGVGYGGSCFPKDVDAFVHLADQLGYDFDLLKNVRQINEAQRDHVMQKIRHELWVIQDKTVAILGLAFKPCTDDVREAASLYFVPRLREAGAMLRLWDPVATDNFKALYPDLAYFTDIEACVRDADLVLILTEWSQIADFGLERLRSLMKCPVVVDGRNMFDPKEMRAKGFAYHCVGRP
ncbi:MAG TPA: UDP-glucose/GDP-mannose dehydrogenase family protein [Kiritimatiellia bacterium]|nr:UDP-glucose/GDP-mannose dehydrogenase family protein [Kiritimatiellia bacterium]HRZ12113.1 UDP-glucose/GDP-mannose dehydrogenase family protein [Kiritimatiellia bacterium]HSA18129.1 UDP-glucose/GDP-mannose dehydrogenase family protein [Kiritimatiellia bacterium]